MSDILRDATTRTLGASPLACVDGSKATMGALRFAVELAKAARQKLHVVIVDEVSHSIGTYLSHGHHLADLLDKARALWEIHASEAERAVTSLARSNWVDVEVQHRAGSAGSEIVEASETATIVVLGRRGAGDARRVGSSTSYVMRHCRRPVLLVPERFHAPTTVVAAYAAKALGTVVLRRAAELSKLLRLPLEVQTVGRDKDERSRVLDQARQQLSESATTSFSGIAGRPEEVLVAATHPRTILVIGAYGGSRLQRMVLGSTTEQVVWAARGPVMIAHAEE